MSPRDRARWGGWAVVAAVAVIAIARAVSATHPAPSKRLTDEELREEGRAAALREPGWRLEAQRSFPGDAWSQDDDFSARERKWAIDEARWRGVPVSEIFRAIDAELRASSPLQPPRDPGAAPSKPRPFYD